MQNYETGKKLVYLFSIWAYCTGKLGINGEKMSCETELLGSKSKGIDPTKQSP